MRPTSETDTPAAQQKGRGVDVGTMCSLEVVVVGFGPGMAPGLRSVSAAGLSAMSMMHSNYCNVDGPFSSPLQDIGR